MFVGPEDFEVRRLARLPNVHFLGAQEYKSLPAHVAHFDVCTIPFRVNALTRAVDPVKLYEYLAAGKPVVSTRLPEVEARQSLCYVAGTPEEFLEQLTLALNPSPSNATPPRDAIRQRVEFARANTWSQRVAEIESVFTRHLAV